MPTLDIDDSAHGVVRVRDRLVSPPTGHRRLVGAELRAALTDLYELWLTRHAAACGVTGSGLALVAVGALGRREMMPYSDLDLLLVHDGVKRAKVEALAEQLWYPMWDAGIGLDHAVRTPAQAVKVAAGDLRTALGLLEARHIAGDAELSARLIADARKQWRAGLRKRVDEIAESANQRWAGAGEIAQRAEPDLKHGRGGLRDFQILYALAAAQLVDRPSGEVRAAGALLADVRTELHRAAGRARDVLRAQDGDEVAAALRLGDKFDLARGLSGAGRAIDYAMQVGLRAARAAKPGGRVSRTPLDDGVVLHGAGSAAAEVALARGASPRSDPALLLRVATASARAGVPVAAGTLATLADQAPEPATPWPPAVLRQLLALLGTGEGLVEVTEALDRTGLWGRLFPEWGAVRDLPPRDAPHVYTVDRHLVQTCVQAAALVTTVSRPDLLLLGALVHDIGKGRAEDHSVVGAKLATQIGIRVGLPDADVRTLSLLVRHHLLLAHTATRRDVTDPVTVARVTDAVGSDAVLLELLHALTRADSLATGPGVWSQWKAGLVAGLVEATRTAIAGEVVAWRTAVPTEAVELTATFTGGVDLVMREDGDLAELTVLAAEAPTLLSRAAGALVLAGLRVHAATVTGHGAEHGDCAVLQFTVAPRFGSLPDPAALRDQLRLAITGALPIAEKVAAKERDYARSGAVTAPPRLLWFDDEAAGATVLEVRVVDAIGLLYRVTAVLERCGLGLRWARTTTLGPTAFISVCLLDATGARPDAALRDRLTIELTAALNPA